MSTCETAGRKRGILPLLPDPAVPRRTPSSLLTVHRHDQPAKARAAEHHDCAIPAGRPEPLELERRGANPNDQPPNRPNRLREASPKWVRSDRNSRDGRMTAPRSRTAVRYRSASSTEPQGSSAKSLAATPQIIPFHCFARAWAPNSLSPVHCLRACCAGRTVTGQRLIQNWFTSDFLDPCGA